MQWHEYLLPQVQSHQALPTGFGALPGAVDCGLLPPRLRETFIGQSLRRWRGTGPTLTIQPQEAPVSSYCRRSLKPFQRKESYRLTIGPDLCRLDYEDLLGAFRGLTTLEQWLQVHRDLGRKTLAGARIVDYPRLEYRGLMYDFAREQVHHEGQLQRLLELCVRLKFNWMTLYLEEHFQYPSLALFRGNAHFLSPQQARHWDQWAQANFLTLVPQTNCLGHNEGFVSREEFAELAEDRLYGAQLCPSKAATLRHLRARYRDLADVFRAPILHVGGDEAWELAHCADCRRFCRAHGRRQAVDGGERGKGQLYLRHLLKVHDMVRGLGRRTAVWGDMIKKHPEIAARVPREVVIHDWVYHRSDPRSLREFRDRGHDVVASASEGGWSHVGPELEQVLQNIHMLFDDAIRLNLLGGELTCWEMEKGHYFHTSLYPVVYAGHYLWSGRKLAAQRYVRSLSLATYGVDSPLLGRLVQGLLIDANRTSLAGLRDSSLPGLHDYTLEWPRQSWRKAIFSWTTEIPEKQSPFYHLIGLLTSSAFDRRFPARLQTQVRAAQGHLLRLEKVARRNREHLFLYDILCHIHLFNIHLLQRLPIVEKQYRRAASLKTRGRAGWFAQLRGLLELLDEIEQRYRWFINRQQRAVRLFGHAKLDVANLRQHLRVTRQFKRKVLALRRSPQPLPNFHRFLLEYPIRDW